MGARGEQQIEPGHPITSSARSKRSRGTLMPKLARHPQVDDELVLIDLLKKLVRHGVLRRVPYQARPKRYEYILTQKGLDLYPIIMAIVHWGDVHMVDERGRPQLYQHKLCRKMFDPVMTCSACGEPLSAREVHVHLGPGADENDRAPSRSARPARAEDGVGE